MRTSQKGIDLIKRFEGCRLKAYRCAAGVPTIGYGHTAGVKMGQTITQMQAESFLKDDLMKYEAKVEKYRKTYRWNQNEFDALVSFAYNTGSIDQLTANGRRTREQIAKAIPRYNKAAGKVLPGLTSRRHAELELFVMPEAAKKEQSVHHAASVEAGHVQRNYQIGKTYTLTVNLNIRTKRSAQDPAVIPSGAKIGLLNKGTVVKNQATARIGEAIWMYIGTDKKGREQWVCADNGVKAYIC